MPYIEVRYDKNEITEREAMRLSHALQPALRGAIQWVRPQKKDSEYQVFVEMDPFHLHAGQPGVRVHIFYYPEWNFSEEEIKKLKDRMEDRIKATLKSDMVSIKTEVDLRFFVRQRPTASTRFDA